MYNLIQNHTLCYVAFNLAPTNINDLPLKQGDVITVSTESFSGWAFGYSDGKLGWLPLNYVEPIDEAFVVRRNFGSTDTVSDKENYKSVIQAISEDEKEYLKNYKQKFEKIQSDLLSKVISCKVDATTILKLSEQYVKKYDKFLAALEKESQKPVHKQTFFKLYKSFFDKTLKKLLHYCNLHPYFIKSLFLHKDLIEAAKAENQINNTIINITKFFAMPFNRLTNNISNLRDLLDCFKPHTTTYLDGLMAISSVGFLQSATQFVRKEYCFIVDALPQLEVYMVEDKIHKRDPSYSLIHYCQVQPLNRDPEDSKEYHLIFHLKRAFYGTVERYVKFEFKVLEVFSVENTKIEVSYPDKVNNVISLSNNEGTDSPLLLVVEDSHEQKFLVSMWSQLQSGKEFKWFWVDTKISGLTVPRIPILSIKERIDKLKVSDSMVQTEKTLGYGEFDRLIRTPCSIQSRSVIDKPGVYADLVGKMSKMEEQMVTLARKVDNLQRREKNMEELIKSMIKANKTTL